MTAGSGMIALAVTARFQALQSSQLATIRKRSAGAPEQQNIPDTASAEHTRGTTGLPASISRAEEAVSRGRRSARCAARRRYSRHLRFHMPQQHSSIAARAHQAGSAQNRSTTPPFLNLKAAATCYNL